MSEHTCGEWNQACDSYGKVQHSRKYDCVYTVIKAGTGGRAERIHTVAARIENGADARLIAAAPQLLIQLKIANDNLSLLHSEWTEGHSSSVETCDCAIGTNWRSNKAAILKACGQ